MPFLVHVLWHFWMVCREVLKEDAAGSLQASVDDVVHKSKRRRLLDRPVNVRLGMVCFLTLWKNDCCSNMTFLFYLTVFMSNTCRSDTAESFQADSANSACWVSDNRGSSGGEYESDSRSEFCVSLLNSLCYRDHCGLLMQNVCSSDPWRVCL